MQTVIKVAGIALLFLGLAHSAEAQTGPWSTQGPSNCSDQYGAFDGFIPGMRGSGACTRGGFVPGTTVISVTTRNATGAGSLENALSASCPKVILFDVGGLINLNGNSGWDFSACSQYSIVGASAPGEVTLTGNPGRPMLRMVGNNYTLDHLTLATGDFGITPEGSLSNRDNLGNGDGGTESGEGFGIIFNNNIIWDADEGISCFARIENQQSNITWWQNIIAVEMASSSGMHTQSGQCINASVIRNAYVHGHERVPMIRSDNFFVANNIIANIFFRGPQISPCASQTPPIQNPFRVNAMHNLNAKSQNSNASQRYLENPDGSSCTNFQIYETGNRVREDNGTIYDCSNHACSGGINSFNSNVWETSIVSSAYPTGYVPETIPNTQAGFEAFADQLFTFIGSRPTDRLSYVQTRIVDEATDIVDGTDTSSTYSSRSSSSAEGGINVITPSNASWNASAQCGGMPTGAAADGIQSSGLTGLHEWVIGCFYDNVMPAGYREDKLQNYPAPGGGGSGPPPSRPNPPILGVGSP